MVLLFNLSDISHCRTINCFDLQELLEACLPNDYIRSCANLGIIVKLLMFCDDVNDVLFYCDYICRYLSSNCMLVG